MPKYKVSKCQDFEVEAQTEQEAEQLVDQGKGLYFGKRSYVKELPKPLWQQVKDQVIDVN